MSKLRDWLCADRGRATRLAKHLGVPQSFVSKMASGEKPIPIQHMTAIEVFTERAITRQDMCPADWSRIWPELVRCSSSTGIPEQEVANA